jgi:ankyrin repeat protein
LIKKKVTSKDWELSRAVNQHGMSQLLVAVTTDNADMVKYLISKGADKEQLMENTADSSPIVWAAGQGCLNALKVLVTSNVDMTTGINLRDRNLVLFLRLVAN